MSEKEFLIKFLEKIFVELEEEDIDIFLTEHHKEYYEVEFVNIAEDEEENRNIMQEQEANYNADIKASIERSSWK